MTTILKLITHGAIRSRAFAFLDRVRNASKIKHMYFKGHMQTAKCSTRSVACARVRSRMFNFGAFGRDRAQKLNNGFPMYICKRSVQNAGRRDCLHIFLAYYFIINFNCSREHAVCIGNIIDYISISLIIYQYH